MWFLDRGTLKLIPGVYSYGDPNDEPSPRRAWHTVHDRCVRSGPGTASYHSAGGFEYASWVYSPIGADMRLVAVPLWAVAVPPALVWTLASATVRRRRRRAAAGRCERCGYDLRGSAGRCPECGAVPISVGTGSPGSG